MTHTPSEASSFKPGWYVHPEMVNTMCFWDGQVWTDQVAPMAPVLPAAPEVQRVTFNGEGMLALVLFLTLLGIIAAVVVTALGSS